MQNGCSVQGSLNIESIVLGAVVDERKALAFTQFGHRVSQTENWLNVEVFLDHSCSHTFLKSRHEDSPGEFLLLLLLFIEESAAERSGLEHVVGEAW